MSIYKFFIFNNERVLTWQHDNGHAEIANFPMWFKFIYLKILSS